MFMLQTAVKSAKVREKFSQFVDSVIHESPRIVNRTRDYFLAININHLAPLVQDYYLTVELQQDELGSFIATFKEIPDLIGYAETDSEAIEQLVNNLIEYAHDYLTESFSLYFKAPNRQAHFPYVLKVMMQNSAEDVMSFIRV